MPGVLVLVVRNIYSLHSYVMVDSFADFSDIGTVIVTAVLQMITAKQLQHFVQRSQL